MDYVAPKQLVVEIFEAARKKATLPVRDLMIRGILAGVFLGYATSLVMVVSSQGLPAIVGPSCSLWASSCSCFSVSN